MVVNYQVASEIKYYAFFSARWDELWLKGETELGQAEIAVLQETLGCV